VIPLDYITEWRQMAPWTQFQQKEVSRLLAFRGGTALYQRKKIRDLFDLWDAWIKAKPDSSRIVVCFLSYVERSGLTISRAEFEANLIEKMKYPNYTRDIEPLLASAAAWRPQEAADYIMRELLPLLPGEPLKRGR
jgi:hypothetical protein